MALRFIQKDQTRRTNLLSHIVITNLNTQVGLHTLLKVHIGVLQVAVVQVDLKGWRSRQTKLNHESHWD